MDFTFTGVIKEVMPVQQGTSKRDGKPWAKQEYVIEEVNQRYPSRCAFQVFGQDRLQQFGIGEGEMLTVHLGLNANRSREGRWFNQLDCWKVERFGQRQDAQIQYRQQPGAFDRVDAANGGFGQSAAPGAPFPGA